MATVTRNNNFLINEGNNIGHNEPQAFGTDQKNFKAAAALVKGMPVYISGDWALSPATNLTACHGFSFDDYASGANAVLVTEGFIQGTCGAAITAGAEVAVGADSKIIAAVAAAHRIGFAVNTTTAADQKVYVKVTLAGKAPA